jgi:hypothetical protein
MIVRELEPGIVLPTLVEYGMNVRQQTGEQLSWDCDLTKKYITVFSLTVKTIVLTPSISTASSTECSIEVLSFEQGGEEDMKIEVIPSTGNRR